MAAGAVRLEVRESTLLLLDIERNEFLALARACELLSAFSRWGCEGIGCTSSMSLTLFCFLKVSLFVTNKRHLVQCSGDRSSRLEIFFNSLGLLINGPVRKILTLVAKLINIYVLTDL